jgi:hypothetical protein
LDTEIVVKPFFCRNRVPPELVMEPEFAPDTVAVKDVDEVDIFIVSPLSNNKEFARVPAGPGLTVVEPPLQPILAAYASLTIVVQRNADTNNRNSPRDAASSP